MTNRGDAGVRLSFNGCSSPLSGVSTTCGSTALMCSRGMTWVSPESRSKMSGPVGSNHAVPGPAMCLRVSAETKASPRAVIRAGEGGVDTSNVSTGPSGPIMRYTTGSGSLLHLRRTPTISADARITNPPAPASSTAGTSPPSCPLSEYDSSLARRCSKAVQFSTSAVRQRSTATTATDSGHWRSASASWRLQRLQMTDPC